MATMNLTEIATSSDFDTETNLHAQFLAAHSAQRGSLTSFLQWDVDSLSDAQQGNLRWKEINELPVMQARLRNEPVSTGTRSDGKRSARIAIYQLAATGDVTDQYVGIQNNVNTLVDDAMPGSMLKFNRDLLLGSSDDKGAEGVADSLASIETQTGASLTIDSGTPGPLDLAGIDDLLEKIDGPDENKIVALPKSLLSKVRRLEHETQGGGPIVEREVVNGVSVVRLDSGAILWTPPKDSDGLEVLDFSGAGSTTTLWGLSTDPISGFSLWAPFLPPKYIEGDRASTGDTKESGVFAIMALKWRGNAPAARLDNITNAANIKNP